MDVQRKSNQGPEADSCSSRRSFLRRAGLFASTVVAGSVSAACAGLQPVAPAAVEVPTATAAPEVMKPRRGGKLSWAMFNNPEHLAPHGGTSGSEIGREHCYESLLDWDKDLLIQPAIAERWEMPDEKTVIWYLRQGVKFHSGSECTAEDVKYSIDVNKTFKVPVEAPNPNYPAIADVEIVDKYTLKMNMEYTDPTIIGYYAWKRTSAIVPQGAYEKYKFLTDEDGTGPFKLVSFVPNDRLEYVRHEEYWNPNLPYVDGYTMKVMPDESARLAALRSGELDGCEILPDQVPLLKNDSNITVLRGLQSAPRVLQFSLRNQGKPWEDKRVRVAMSIVLDRQDIIEKVYNGEGVLSAMVPPGYGDWFIPPEELAQKWFKRDVEHAKELMAEAGYKDGFAIEILTFPGWSSKTAEVVKEQWKLLNIEATVVTEEFTAFVQRILNVEFDIFSTGRGFRHDVTGFLSEHGNVEAFRDFAFGEGWKDEEVSRMFQELRSTWDDAKRHELARAIQERLLDDPTHIYLCQPYWFVGVRNHVKDMYVSFQYAWPGLKTVWLDA